jgi:predicted ferric reductase
MQSKRLFWQAFYILNWLLILGFWFYTSGSSLTAGFGNAAIAIGRLLGLVATYMVLTQFFLMGRSPFLEGVFGLDKLSRLHHINGRYSILFLIAHPIALTIGYASFSEISWFNQFVQFIYEYEHVNLAFLGLIGFLIVGFSSYKISRSRLRYESWYFVHLIVYLAVLGSFFHQTDIGSDFLANAVFTNYWLALYLFVFVQTIFFRFARPLYNFQRFQFTVDHVQRETKSVTSVYITGKNLHRFFVRPGQFMIFRFLTKGMWWQAHPFSLSWVPKENKLRISVKELGDFTRQINTLKPGTKVIIDGPYGVFTEKFLISTKVLLIAGGIGITPIRSLAESMGSHAKDIKILYGNRSVDDIAFKDELDTLATKYSNLSVTHIISDDPSYPGEKGRVDKEKIKTLVPDLLTRDVYVCGPPPMMDGVVASLRELGVPEAQIHFEKFSL